MSPPPTTCVEVVPEALTGVVLVDSQGRPDAWQGELR